MIIKIVVQKTACLLVSGFFMGTIFLAGCASLQTESLLRSENKYPQKVELSSVPFFAQEQYQCGPAALAMMLQTETKPVTPEELEQIVAYIAARNMRSSLFTNANQ